MASVITVAFEIWKAQEAASGKAVLLDEFVFANVPNLDPAKPIDRNEKLPPANQIVHRQAVNKAGLASENAVAYSVTLGAEVGNFDFNWIGLLNKASGTVAMITHAPIQKKLKTQNGQQGNVLTRSFILEFQGAAEETQIKTSAETWQIDFTARLSGIDEMQRLINVDSYGAAAFFNDGFEVIRSGEQYTVKKGLGYVGGLRGELTQNQILNGLRNTKVYADFSYQGNIVSQWNTVVKITAAATLTNYVDTAGFTHQVFAIASIDASGNVKDLRSMGALSSQEISALETRLKLDLSKKIDKANISGVLGNDNDKVPSLNLLATELGKKQPAGNYAPAGDYATNTALNNGLDKKFDKTGGAINGGISATGAIQTSGGQVTVHTAGGTGAQLDSRGDIARIRSRNKTGKWFDHVIPEVDGTLMQIGDLGLGGFGVGIPGGDYEKIDKSGFYSGVGGGAHVNAPPQTVSGNPLYGALLAAVSSVNEAFFITAHNKEVTYRIKTGGVWGSYFSALTTANTQADHNGNVKILGYLERSDYPVGCPIPWPQSSAPAGYLICNGQVFNKTTYPLLAKAYPSGILPDLRGEFLRGLDAGRNIDVNRSVNSFQDGQVGEITCIATASDNDLMIHSSSSKYLSRGDIGTNVNSITFNVGKENRVRNIAFLYIVRAA
ncbi:phage tail protein [Providencia hangzhouensis]|uniref:Phage tail protein n=1 Tax=Providencia hangzhouensis TaxID=3031799 RepID=A0ABY9ZD26_9GAMM|nr:phage tail protein [Providencia hangzhouensis]WNK25644.1 phage tail protein [Providencia hangzhouensis]